MSQEPEFSVQVECSAGHRGELTPSRFSVRGRPVEVTEVFDAWLATDHRYFKVRGDDGACYILTAISRRVIGTSLGMPARASSRSASGRVSCNPGSQANEH